VTGDANIGALDTTETGAATPGAGVKLNTNDENIAFNGIISGTGSLTKTGSGVLTLTGSNDYSGGTTVSNGILQIGNGGNTGSIVGDIINNANVTFNRRHFDL
jgi:fibronectin-binding autotransporter adhesin